MKGIEIKAELEKVLSIINTGIQQNRLEGIQRDIVLEKLRKVYEELLSGDFLSIVKSGPDVMSAYLSGQETAGDKLDRDEELLPSAAHQQTEIPATMEELIEKPFVAHKPIDRNIIETLYGGSELCKKPEPAPLEEEAPEVNPLFEESPETVSQSLNESLANETKDVASVLSAQTASQLRNTLGLNDRLMLLNDLFDNDADLLEQTLDALDQVDSIDDAYIYLYEHCTVDDEKEGAKLLISLLDAKFN